MSTIDRAAMRKRAEGYLHGCERTGNADSRLAQIARDVLLLLDGPPVSADPGGGRWWSRRFAPTGAGYPRWHCARCEADTDADAAPLRCAHCGYGASGPPKPGHYWWRTSDGSWEPVHVDVSDGGALFMRRPGIDFPYSLHEASVAGTWGPAIPMPNLELP